MGSCMITFTVRDWDINQVYFKGVKKDSGRYEPINKFIVDKYRQGFIEVENTHKGVEFLRSEIKIVEDYEIEE